MPVDGQFEGKLLIIGIHRNPEVQLRREGRVEIESENSTLRLYSDGADIMTIEHRLRDIKVSHINTTDSFIKEMDAEISIHLCEEDD